MAYQWFVVRNGKEQGPFSSQQLKSLADGGMLQKNDLVRRDDMKSAAAAHMVKGLFPEAKLEGEIPPPPPKKLLPDTEPTLGERARAEARLEASAMPYATVAPEALPMNPLIFTMLIGALAGVVPSLWFGGFWGFVLTGGFIGATGSYHVARQPGSLFVLTTIVLFVLAWAGVLGKSAYERGYDAGYEQSSTAVKASATTFDESEPAMKKWQKAQDYADAQYEKNSDNHDWLSGYKAGLRAGADR